MGASRKNGRRRGLLVRKESRRNLTVGDLSKLAREDDLLVLLGLCTLRPLMCICRWRMAERCGW